MTASTPRDVDQLIALTHAPQITERLIGICCRVDVHGLINTHSDTEA